MKMSKERKAIILAGLLICGGGQGAVINALSIFVKPVTEALSFSRGEFTLYSSIISLVSVLTLPIYGELYRKKWFSTYMLCCAFLYSMVPMGYSFCKILPAFYILSVILGLVFHGNSITAVANILNKWFGRNKGFATGICFGGSGVFAAIMLRIGNSVIQEHGWEWGYRSISICSLMLLLVGTFIVFWLEHHDKLPAADDPEFLVTIKGHSDVELTRAEALRTIAFWSLLLSVFIVGFATQSGASSVAAYLSDLGYSPDFQGIIASMSMLALGIGKIFVGRLLDRAGLRVGFTVTVLALILDVGSLITMRMLVSPYVYVVCYGIAASGTTVLASYSVATCFGRKEYSRIYVLISVAVNLGLAAGNWVPGAIFDVAGNYMPAWHMLLVLAVATSGLFFAICIDHKKRCARIESIADR